MLDRKISLKDCVIAILLLLLIGVFTYRFGDIPQVISHLNSGSTLVSIVLSLIAIIYTLYQSILGNSQAERLNEASNRLVDNTNRLESATHVVTEMHTQTEQLAASAQSLSGTASELETALEAATHRLQDAVEAKLSAHMTPLQEQLQRLLAERVAGGQSNDTTHGVTLQVDVPDALYGLMGPMFASVYLAYKHSQQPDRGPLLDLLNNLFENHMPSVFLSFGCLLTLDAAEFFDFDLAGNNTKVLVPGMGQILEQTFTSKKTRLPNYADELDNLWRKIDAMFAESP